MKLPPPDEEAETGLPLLRTWRSAYLFVAVVFFLYVACLLALERLYT